jgi:hypothetical protein
MHDHYSIALRSRAKRMYRRAGREGKTCKVFALERPKIDRLAEGHRRRPQPHLHEHNFDPKPFMWTKPARDILAKPTRLPAPSV